MDDCLECSKDKLNLTIDRASLRDADDYGDGLCYRESIPNGMRTTKGLLLWEAFRREALSVGKAVEPSASRGDALPVAWFRVSWNKNIGAVGFW